MLSYLPIFIFTIIYSFIFPETIGWRDEKGINILDMHRYVMKIQQRERKWKERFTCIKLKISLARFLFIQIHIFFHLFTSKIVSCSFHKYDKLGRPCYIEHTGRTDTTALMKVCSKHLKSGSIFVLYLSRKMYFLKRSFGFFLKISKQIQIKTCLSFYM